MEDMLPYRRGQSEASPRLYRGPFWWHGLDLISAWISSYIHYKVWYKFTCRFTDFNGAAINNLYLRLYMLLSTNIHTKSQFMPMVLWKAIRSSTTKFLPGSPNNCKIMAFREEQIDRFWIDLIESQWFSMLFLFLFAKDFALNQLWIIIYYDVFSILSQFAVDLIWQRYFWLWQERRQTDVTAYGNRYTQKSPLNE